MHDAEGASSDYNNTEHAGALLNSVATSIVPPDAAESTPTRNLSEYSDGQAPSQSCQFLARIGAICTHDATFADNFSSALYPSVQNLTTALSPASRESELLLSLWNGHSSSPPVALNLNEQEIIHSLPMYWEQDELSSPSLLDTWASLKTHSLHTDSPQPHGPHSSVSDSNAPRPLRVRLCQHSENPLGFLEAPAPIPLAYCAPGAIVNQFSWVLSAEGIVMGHTTTPDYDEHSAQWQQTHHTVLPSY